MNLFRFANPEYLYLLLAVPVMILIFVFNRIRQNQALERYGDRNIVTRLIPDLSSARPVVKLIFSVLTLIFLSIVLARPQFGSRIEEVKRKGIEVIVALDVSNSMLAEDVQPSRLERAKQALSRLVETLTDDKFGLIVFAGDAYIQIPLTADYVSAKMFLSTINPSAVPKQGTAIGSAISLAMRSFSQGQDKSRAMIIITDGENHEDDPVSAATEAAKQGIVIHTVGIGSPEGVPVALTVNGRREFLKDHEGNTVITKLNENILKEIAVAGNGKYVRATSASLGLEQILSEIRKMSKQEIEGKVFTEYNDQFQFFAGLALIFILADFLLMDKKNRKLSGLKIFKLRF